MDVHEKDNEEEVRQEKITNNNQKDDNGSDSEHEQDMDEDDTVEITTTKITQEDKETNGSTNIDRDEEKNAKMVRKQKAVVDLLQKPRDDILRILAQEIEPFMFLTQLLGEIEVRVVHSVAHVTAPLGHPHYEWMEKW